MMDGPRLSSPRGKAPRASHSRKRKDHGGVSEHACFRRADHAQKASLQNTSFAKSPLAEIVTEGGVTPPLSAPL